MADIRVLLVDDHAILRDGIRMVLESQADMKVVGEAGSGEEALRSMPGLRPDVVVMDITLPGMSGLEATRSIRTEYPGSQVLILSMHEDEAYLKEALRAGAAGYVLKKAAARQLVEAIRAVNDGQAYLEPSLTRSLITDYLSRREDAPELTEREAEVVRLIAEGNTNQVIAQQLCLSIKTVESHRTNAMHKLGLHDRVELVKYALRKGMIRLD